MKRIIIAVFVAGIALGAQAQRLPRTIMPVHYDLTFTPDFVKDTFEGDETIQISVQQSVREILLHAKFIDIREVTVASRGKAQTAKVTANANDMLTLAVPDAIPIGPATIHILYSASINDRLQGLYLGRANGKKYAATQMEATYARQAFPCFDEPAMKATFAITAVVDDGHVAISNGTILSDTPGPAGKHTVRFSTTPRMSSYLVALVIGDFKAVEGEVAGIPLRIWSTPDKVELGRFPLEVTKNVLTYYNRYYGIKYPFEKLDQIAIPDFQAGAMENIGAIIYRETALLVDEKSAPIDQKRRVSSVIAHEIAHQWFGDLVTMEWWDDIWLNEGFATWMTPKGVGIWKPEWATAANVGGETAKTIASDSLQSTRPIRTAASSTSQIDELFDGIAYGKTAAMLRMVEAYIGEPLFRQGINDYLSENAYDNATAEDFIRAMSRASGQPLSPIFDSYVRNSGVPILTVGARCDNGTTLLAVSQRRFYGQRKRMAQPSPEIWTIPMCYRHIGEGGKTEEAESEGGEEMQCAIVSEPKQVVRVPGCDPVFVNRAATGYYLTEYTPQTLAEIKAHVGDLTAAERVALLRDEGRLLRVGFRGVGDYLALAESFRSERDPDVLEQIVETLQFIDETVTADATREPFRQWVRSFLGPIVNEVGWAPGSGEAEARTELRAKAMEALGNIGRDKKTIEQAKTLARRALDNPSSVEPTLASAALAVAAAYGDAKFYDRVLRGIDSAKTPEQRARLMATLTEFRDPALARRTLEWAVSPAVRIQDFGRLAGGTLANYEVRRAAWDYLTTNWAKVAARIPGLAFGGLGAVVGSAGGFCDAEMRESVRTFFGAHPIPGTERRLAQALERIEQCADIRTLQSPKLEEWLGKK